MRNFLIDTDTASDDAVAIIMALAEPSVKVLGLTTVAGNVDLKQATRNALLTAEICKSDTPVFIGADKPLKRAHRPRALVPRQGRPRRSQLSGAEAQGGARSRGRRDPAPREGRARPHPDHARAAHQYRACAQARSRTRGADRPLRGDGRRALLRGQCDAGGRIQHLGRSGGGARRVPLEAQDRNDRLACLARPLGVEGRRDRGGRGDRHGESEIRHRIQHRRPRGLSRSDRRDRPLASPIRSRWRSRSTARSAFPGRAIAWRSRATASSPAA